MTVLIQILGGKKPHRLPNDLCIRRVLLLVSEVGKDVTKSFTTGQYAG